MSLKNESVNHHNEEKSPSPTGSQEQHSNSQNHDADSTNSTNSVPHPNDELANEFSSVPLATMEGTAETHSDEIKCANQKDEEQHQKQEREENRDVAPDESAPHATTPPEEEEDGTEKNSEENGTKECSVEDGTKNNSDSAAEKDTSSATTASTKDAPSTESTTNSMVGEASTSASSSLNADSSFAPKPVVVPHMPESTIPDHRIILVENLSSPSSSLPSDRQRTFSGTSASSAGTSSTDTSTAKSLNPGDTVLESSVRYEIQPHNVISHIKVPFIRDLVQNDARKTMARKIGQEKQEPSYGGPTAFGKHNHSRNGAHQSREALSTSTTSSVPTPSPTPSDAPSSDSSRHHIAPQHDGKSLVTYNLYANVSSKKRKRAHVQHAFEDIHISPTRLKNGLVNASEGLKTESLSQRPPPVDRKPILLQDVDTLASDHMMVRNVQVQTQDSVLLDTFLHRELANKISTRETLKAELKSMCLRFAIGITAIIALLIFVLVLSIPFCEIEREQELIDNGRILTWTYGNCIYYGVVTLTTIGFGDFVPQTSGGRAYMVVFALFGLFFVVLAVGLVGTETMQRAESIAIIAARTSRHVRSKIWGEDIDNTEVEEPINKIDRITKIVLSPYLKLFYILVVVLLYLLFGAMMFSILEDLTYGNAIYFSFIILTTIGYGDIVPYTTEGRVFLVIYSIIGFILIGFILGFLGEVTLHLIDTQRLEVTKRITKKKEELREHHHHELVLTEEYKPYKLELRSDTSSSGGISSDGSGEGTVGSPRESPR